MLVFSGVSDPEFDLSDNESLQLAGLLSDCFNAGGTAGDGAEPARLGYRGFRLTTSDRAFPYDMVTVTEGKVIAASSEALTSFNDSAGCEAVLLGFARDHGFGDVLDELGVGGQG
jgi:hypothetical protein